MRRGHLTHCPFSPLIIYESVTSSPTRIANIKNFTLFDQDLANGVLPQWIFITPNMSKFFCICTLLYRCLSTIHAANDGHDSSITVAGEFANSFLTPLLANSNFNSAKTLVFLSMFFLLLPRFHSMTNLQLTKSNSLAFDETSSSTSQNRVVGILLGSAVPSDLVGTSDTAFYDHYSQLATVEANWDLPTLGRYDVGANVFSFVAQQTGDTVRALTSPSLSQTLLDASYPGIFNSEKTAPLPIPNTTLVVNGRSVLPAIVETWGSAALQACTTYNGSLGVPSAKNPPVLPKGCN